jgi:hypothetical protein
MITAKLRPASRSQRSALIVIIFLLVRPTRGRTRASGSERRRRQRTSRLGLHERPKASPTGHRPGQRPGALVDEPGFDPRAQIRVANSQGVANERGGELAVTDRAVDGLLAGTFWRETAASSIRRSSIAFLLAASRFTLAWCSSVPTQQKRLTTSTRSFAVSAA